jgi:hypothetical protein
MEALVECLDSITADTNIFRIFGLGSCLVDAIQLQCWQQRRRYLSADECMEALERLMRRTQRTSLRRILEVPADRLEREMGRDGELWQRWEVVRCMCRYTLDPVATIDPNYAADKTCL